MNAEVLSIPLLTTVVLVYFAILGALTIRAWKKTRSTSDFLLAGRQIHPVVMALSYGATFISTSAIIGFGGAAGVFGMSLMWLCFLTIFVGIFVAFVFFGRRTRIMGLNLGAHTFPELLGRRFESTRLQGMAGLLVFAAMPLYASVVLMGGGKFIARVLDMNYDIALFFLTVIVAIYVVMGGLRAVMYTDAFQGSIMFAGLLILVYAAYAHLGGFVEAHQRLSEMAPIAQKIFGAKGHQGWTSFPALLSEYWLIVVTTIIMGVGIGVLAQPQLIVRFMTVRSNRELNRAVPIGGLFILVTVGGAFIVGALSNVWFYAEYEPTQGKIALLAADKNISDIIPLFIQTAMPGWFTAVFMVTLLSAAMSTLSSQFHAMGTSLGRDVWEKWLGSPGGSVLINRLGVLVAILLSYFLAWGLPRFFEGGTAIIARGTAIFFGICAAAFLPAYFGALYSRRMTRLSVWASFVVGTLTSLFWLFFMHTSESKPLMLCRKLFGVDSLAAGTRWEMVDPIVVALPVSALVALLLYRVGTPPDATHISRCFQDIRSPAADTR